MITRGDARSLPLADASVQCVVTSPPYWGLRDYGTPGQLGLEPSPDAYVASMVAVFAEVWRVLKADGVLWLNLGDCYNARPGQRKTSDKVGAKQETNAGSNSVGSRHTETLKPKDLIGMPWRVAFALQAAGWYLRSDVIWSKPNPMPESVKDRPTKAHEYVFLLAKSERYFFDAEAVKEKSSGVTGGGWSKAYAEPQPSHGGMSLDRPMDNGTRNIRSVWTINPRPFAGAHFATFPEELPTRCILAGSRPGDIILDPFLGSGTVGRVATSLGRRFVGVELNAEYCQLAARRCQVTRGLPLEFSA